MDPADGGSGGSVYGTPAADSLFSTPASTPHRVAYRMNPVKLVRQHIPSKLQSSQNSSQNAFSDRDSLNSNSSMNPMRTKRIKCVIQPTSSYGDGIAAHLSDSQRNTISDDKPLPSLANKNNLVASSNCVTPEMSHSTGQRLPRNPYGDAENAGKLANDEVEENSPIWCTEPPLELADLNVESPEIPKSVAAVEEEVASIDRLIQNRFDEVRVVGEVATTRNDTEQRDAVDTLKKDEPRKAPAKKNVGAKSNTDTNATHGCEKKKFYDPQDIRKYMMKKKNERRAKEKEEKCKKANELAALKRKAEVTKLFAQRSRPSCEQVNEAKSAKALKNSKSSRKNEKSPNEKKTTTAVAKSGLDSHPRSVDDEDDNCNGRHLAFSLQRTNSRKLVECDFNDVEKTGRYFEEKFNDIVAKCVNEVNKIANLDLRNWTEGTETLRADFQRSRTNDPELITLPPQVDILRHSKSSYNFLDALKSKINLAQDTVEDLPVAPLADRTRRENVLEKRRRLANPPSHIDDAQSLIKPELTLSDLNSPQQKNRNETYIIDGAQVVAPINRRSETFILNTNELRRKSPKLGRSSTLKENRRPSETLDVSGVAPLVPLGDSVLTTATAPATKSATNLADVFNRLQESKHQPQLDVGSSDANLIKIFNLESLRAPNVSVSVPQSWICENNEGELCREGVTKIDADGEVVDIDSNSYTLENVTSMTSTVLLAELYDQMIKSEDDKLSQVLRKIHQQKEALNKHLKGEIFSLELKKNQYREQKDEEKVKALKKKQRAVLLRVTKNIVELDRMKKSVVETVEHRKAELMKQKSLVKDGRTPTKLRQQNLKPRKRTESNSAAYMISNQTVFGISTSSCTSFLLEGENKDTATLDTREIINHKITEMSRESISKDEIIDASDGNAVGKDPPVPFKPGISIRLDLDADRLLQLKSSCARLKIEAKTVDARDSTDANTALAPEAVHLAVTPITKEIENSAKKDDSYSENEMPEAGSGSKSIKIKRPLSPAVFSSSKKILHSRRLSSGSDLTLPSLNDTTTTDQSDLEIRISALQEQLTQRKSEAERLRKEEKKLRKEKLRSKEQSLIKQLEAYDQYIQRLTKLLAENRSVLREASKPQIKSYAARHRQHVGQQEAVACASSMAPQNSLSDRRYANDAEDTNTEDSDDKQLLRKADSGILIESEGVTEASENANTSSLPIAEASKSETRSSTESVPRTEISSQPPSKHHPCDPSNQFLQLVNDLQSEVFSMSEQLYSSDFVDDIEDAAETKSEVSENVTNENNTSMSIEEILTDNPSDASRRVAADDETPQTVSDTVRTAIESVERVDSDPSQRSQPTPSVTSCLEEDASPTPIPSVDEAAEPVIPAAVVLDEKSATTSELECNPIEKAESISDGEFDFYNVQNVSAIDSLEDDSRTLSEGQIPKAEITITSGEGVPSAADLIVEVRSASSLERSSSPEPSVGEATLEPSNIPPEPVGEDRAQSFNVPNPQTAVATEYCAEETDISESLEYDGIHDASSPVRSEDRVTDLDADDQVNGSSSREEDRSVGEIVAAADHSMSNVLGSTFIEHGDDEDEDEYEECVDESPKQAPIVESPPESSVETRVSEEDLDTKISEGQTPFLRALRREQENMFARKAESMDKIVIELMDTLMEETHAGSADRVEDDESDSENLRIDNLKSNVEGEEKFEVSEEHEKKDTESLDHEWYDKLDLTEARLREAEELRLQQMKIEQEIGELQAQQSTPPYLYFREIPNKPPPPYTPPTGLARLPNTESELRDQVQPIIAKVCAQLQDGVDVNDIDLDDGSPSNKTHRDVTAYRRFLFDLTKEVAQSLLAEEAASAHPLPWEEVSSKKRSALRPEEASEQLQQMVEQKINELFGFRAKMSREKLIIQWSRKKKTDFVDDLLIQELQEEEEDWTNYEKDELFIKNEITKSLEEELIQDTVVSLRTTLQKRQQSF